MRDILERIKDTDANRETYVMGGPRALLNLLRLAGEEIERLRKQPPDEKVYVLTAQELDNVRDLPLAVSRSKKVLEGYRNSLDENVEYTKFTIQTIPMIGWKGES